MQNFDQNPLSPLAIDDGYAADASARAPIPGSTDTPAFRKAILAKLTYAVGKDPAHATDRDWFVATALAVRDHAIDHWTACKARNQAAQKQVCYLSLEFLIGRLLSDTLNNLRLTGTFLGIW